MIINSYAYSSAIPPWTPANLTTPPYMWFNDDSAVTVPLGVSQWNDISGNALHLTQGGSDNRPIAISAGLNGRRTIRFSSSASILVNNNSGARDVFDNQSAGWGAIVFKRNSSDGGAVTRTLFAATNGTTGSGRFVCNAAQGTNTPAMQVRRVDGDSLVTLNGSETVTSAFRIVLYRMDWVNGDGFIAVDGAADTSNLSLTSTGSTSATDSARAITVGAFPSVTGGSPAALNPSDSEIAEIIIGRGTLGSTDIDKLFGYLAHRWGLTGNLDVSHPYKSVGPTV